MSKRYKILLVILIALLGTLVFLEANQKDPVNWYPSYSNKDKIPLGTYAFFNELKKQAPQIEEVNVPPFEFLKYGDIKSGAYFFSGNFLMFDKAEAEQLLEWVNKGNTLFLSSNNFSTTLLDTLKLSQKSRIRKNGLENLPQYQLVNPKLELDSWHTFQKDKEIIHFNEIDTLNQQVLGLVQIKDEDLEETEESINFIEAPFGQGKIYIHSSPEVFSNFFLLSKEKQYAYTQNAISYLDLNEDNFYWDNHYSGGKTINTSPLYILLNNKYLKWAYYFILIGAVLFVFFEGKRKQQSIPVRDPLKNKTYEYTQTIAGMYLERKDHTGIAHKMIDQFYHELRLKYHINTQNSNSNLINDIANKTAHSTEEVKELIEFLQLQQHNKMISKEELKEINKRITNFKH